MCAECMEDVRTYTCGILPLSPNNERSDAPSADKLTALIEAIKQGGIEIRQKSNLGRLLNK